MIMSTSRMYSWIAGLLLLVLAAASQVRAEEPILLQGVRDARDRAPWYKSNDPDQLRARIQVLEQEIVRQRRDIKALRKSARSLEGELEDARDEIARQDQVIADQAETIDALKEGRPTGWRALFSSAGEEQPQPAGELKDCKARNLELVEENARLRRRVNTLEARLEESKQERMEGQVTVAPAAPDPEAVQDDSDAAPAPETPAPEPGETPAPEGIPEPETVLPPADEALPAAPAEETGMDTGATSDPMGSPTDETGDPTPAPDTPATNAPAAPEPADIAAPQPAPAMEDEAPPREEAPEAEPDTPTPAAPDAAAPETSEAADAPDSSDPRTAFALIRDGNRALQRGDVEEARTLFKKARLKKPAAVGATLGLAASSYSLGDLLTAIDLLQDVLEKDPQNPQALGLKGIITWKQGDLESARDDIAQAVRLDPEDAQLHNYYAIVLYDLNEREQALTELQKAVELNPAHAEAHFNLAALLMVLSPEDREEARFHYEKAVSLGSRPDPKLEKALGLDEG